MLDVSRTDDNEISFIIYKDADTDSVMSTIICKWCVTLRRWRKVTIPPSQSSVTFASNSHTTTCRPSLPKTILTTTAIVLGSPGNYYLLHVQCSVGQGIVFDDPCNAAVHLD